MLRQSISSDYLRALSWECLDFNTHLAALRINQVLGALRLPRGDLENFSLRARSNRIETAARIPSIVFTGRVLRCFHLPNAVASETPFNTAPSVWLLCKRPALREGLIDTVKLGLWAESSSKFSLRCRPVSYLHRATANIATSTCSMCSEHTLQPAG